MYNDNPTLEGVKLDLDTGRHNTPLGEERTELGFPVSNGRTDNQAQVAGDVERCVCRPFESVVGSGVRPERSALDLHQPVVGAVQRVASQATIPNGAHDAPRTSWLLPSSAARFPVAGEIASHSEPLNMAVCPLFAR